MIGFDSYLCINRRILEKDHGETPEDNFIHAHSILITIFITATRSIEFVKLDNVQKVGVGNAQEGLADLFVGLKLVKCGSLGLLCLSKVELVDDMAEIDGFMGFP